MIEAMACGTPVIGFRQGSVPEIVKHGVTGFIVNTVAEAVGAVDKLSSIDRTLVHEAFEQHFSVEVMARTYERTYAGLCLTQESKAAMRAKANGSAAVLNGTAYRELQPEGL
jgi:glycosyltransferase involved in cell wall biosynthesis